MQPGLESNTAILQPGKPILVSYDSAEECSFHHWMAALGLWLFNRHRGKFAVLHYEEVEPEVITPSGSVRGSRRIPKRFPQRSPRRDSLSWRRDEICKISLAW